MAAYDYTPTAWTPTAIVVGRGKRPDMFLEVRNTGTTAWTHDVRLAPSVPNDRSSGFKDTTWLSENRVCTWTNKTDPSNTTTVQPNQIARFDWKITERPDWPVCITGGFNENFNLVWDGVTWFPSKGLWWKVVRPCDVGVLMFLWYGPGTHRWNDPTPGTALTGAPVNGIYDSSDPATMRRQLTEIQAAGFDYVILDWWFEEQYGQGQYVRDNAYAMAHMIINEFPNLKFTFLVEPRQPSINFIPSYFYEDMWNEFGDSPQWYRQATKAKTLFTYGGMHGTANSHGFITVEYNNVEPDSNPIDMYWVLEPPRLKNNMFTMYSGFYNYPQCYVNGQCGSVDPSMEGWCFNDQRDFALGRRESLQALVAYGWNEYYEGAMIEDNYRAYNPLNRTPDYIRSLYTGFLASWRG